MAKKKLKKIAESWADSFEDEVNRAVRYYGNEASWKLDKFLPPAYNVKEDIYRVEDLSKDEVEKVFSIMSEIMHERANEKANNMKPITEDLI